MVTQTFRLKIWCQRIISVVSCISASSLALQSGVLSPLYNIHNLSHKKTPFLCMIYGRKQILEPHHEQQIIQSYDNMSNDYTDKFQDFVRVVCSTSSIPRKELYEAWSTAIIIHNFFPEQKRFADLACGHGLLSWALLILDIDSTYDENKSNRSAVCIDRRMPKSAEKLATAMIEQWPMLQDKWDYVESKLDAIVPSSSTLLCGVHACGLLSDQIISLAIHGGSPLALVPCCHSKKSLNDTERIEYKRNQNNDNIENQLYNLSLSEYIDNARVNKLQAAGYSVTRTTIPEEITAQNKLILASPLFKRESMPNEKRHNIIHPTSLNKVGGKYLPSTFTIPLGNDAVSIEVVKALSGRKAADARKLQPSPSLCVSMFTPSDNKVTPKMLMSVIDAIWQPYEVELDIQYADDSPYLHPKTGLVARTFRITYMYENGTNISKERAKQLHDEFCNRISGIFNQIQIRN